MGRLPDLLAVIDADGVIHRSNPAWRTLLGYEASALVGRSIMDFIQADHRDAAREALRTSLEGNRRGSSCGCVMPRGMTSGSPGSARRVRARCLQSAATSHNKGR
ncbi:PAS domain-containing protein [Sphingomonas sp. I4]